MKWFRGRKGPIGTLTRVLDPILRKAKLKAETQSPILVPDITKVNKIENTKLGDRTVFWFGGLHKNSTYQITIVGEFDPKQIYEVYTDQFGEIALGKIVHLVKMPNRIMKGPN